MVRTRLTAALIAVLTVLAGLVGLTWLVAPALAAQKGAELATPQPSLSPPAEAGTAGTAELVAVAVLVITAVVLVGRSLVRSRDGQGTRAGARPPAGPPTEALDAQATQLLLETDNAIRTSEQELGFATARFGEHAATPFLAALSSAHDQLAAAFALQKRIDNDIHASQRVRRTQLSEISARCTSANTLLDEQSASFDRWQDLTARAPEVLAEADAHATQQAARVSRSQQLLDLLSVKYTPQAVAAVASNPAAAASRLEFATSCLTAAGHALASGNTSLAAVYLQAAESAADQASDVLDGVEHLEADLTQAASALPTALRELDADVAEATAVLADQPDDALATLVADTTSAVTQARSQMSAGQFDTLATLRTVAHADAALDQQLATTREEATRLTRARAVLDQAMLAARSSVRTAEDFISTRRGGVGTPARTRLAEARRHFEQAIGFAADGPQSAGHAVNEAQLADALAQQARTLAGKDAASFGRSRPADQDGWAQPGLRGALLGGILIDDLPGGLAPASFGGIGTRARHAISTGRPTGAHRVSH